MISGPNKAYSFQLKIIRGMAAEVIEHCAFKLSLFLAQLFPSSLRNVLAIVLAVVCKELVVGIRFEPFLVESNYLVP